MSAHRNPFRFWTTVTLGSLYGAGFYWMLWSEPICATLLYALAPVILMLAVVVRGRSHGVQYGGRLDATAKDPSDGDSEE